MQLHMCASPRGFRERTDSAGLPLALPFSLWTVDCTRSALKPMLWCSVLGNRYQQLEP